MAVLALGGGAIAQTAPPKPKSGVAIDLPLDAEAIEPSWRTKPDGDDMSREYPPLGQMMSLNGSATITCQVEPDGRVDECHVLSETPVGVGFGAAAVRLSAYFSMNPPKLDGRAVSGKVTIPLVFNMENSAQQSAQEESLPPVAPAALELARKIVDLQHLKALMREGWQSFMDRQAATVVSSGDAQSGQLVVDAFKQGLQETINDEAERHAHALAAKMSEMELRATLAYMGSPAGQAWLSARAQADEAQRNGAMARLSRAARAHMCAKIDCSKQARPQAAASGH